MIILGSAFCALLDALFLMCVLFKRQKQQEKDEASTNKNSYTFSKILESTRHLDDQYIIGRGAHGTVYKAVLGSEEFFAIKKLVFGGERTVLMSMTRGIEMLGKIKHRNLVKLKNFWLTKNYGLILYDYMENGSLSDALHQTSPLSIIQWEVSYRIALGKVWISLPTLRL